ncbi:acylneuraminate cytidylyltransferase [Rubritalea profundi]|nr:acylneuraminate cytidylyltransferase [Rubritalea profundi]
MKPICIIPARGGSKGLPRKNVLPLCGRPLLAWNVMAAVEAYGGDSVFVTTDDTEIAKVAITYGARVIMRPAQLAEDNSSSEDALIHALQEICEQNGSLPEKFLFLQCTSPLTAAQDIRAIMETMEGSQADSAFSATPSHRFLWRPDDNGNAAGVNHDSRIRLRRQDCDPEYSENGAIYAMRTEGFLKNKHRFFGKTVVHEMPEERSWEVDSPTDFAVAEILLGNRISMEKFQLLPSKIEAVIFDFDGVMTDNRVTTDQHGNESVACDRSDGMGISKLRESGIRLLVLSTEENPVVAARCSKLKIECIHGQSDKAARLRQWLKEEQINPENTVYLGNDINDTGCLDIVGCPVVVADAYSEAKQHALIVLEMPGGKGAVRELCDLILNGSR